MPPIDLTQLGTAALADAVDFATNEQGALATTAVQPAAIANMVTSTAVDSIVQITAAAYAALSPPDADTLYLVIG